MDMELELETARGSVGGSGTRAVSLSVDSPTADLGRGDLGGGASRDRTVSRRHVSLRLLDAGGGVAFEVVGRNPVVVRSPDGGGGTSGRLFRRGETGELRPGDALALSLNAPAFWAVRRREGEVEAAVLDAVARRERRTRERKEREREREREKRAAEETALEVTDEGEGEGEEGAVGTDVEGMEVDLSSVDPVREFGFLSMGHEFDSYPKGRIRAPKDWNWFLEETKRSSDADDDEVSNGKGRSKLQDRSKKKDGEGDDEDWTDASEDEKESLATGPSVKRSKYVTRSKVPKKPRQENLKVRRGVNNGDDEEVEEEGDKEDETLGGFVVNDEDAEPLTDLSDEEDEEEEFDDEEDDD